MGAVYMIHASITEYLIIFGTPLGTEGHSGLFLADDYFHILVGEQWAFEPGALEREVYGPGDLHLMRRGVKKQYKMHEGAWAMEYVRGELISKFCRSHLKTSNPPSLALTFYLSQPFEYLYSLTNSPLLPR